MSFMDFLLGKGERTQQFQRFTPEQQQLQNQLIGGVQQQLPQGFDYLNRILSQDPELMQQFEAPARRSFQEQTLPSIAERFTAMNGQRSSAFGQQLGQAGAALEENLAAQRAQLGSNALNQLLSLFQLSQTPQFENIVRPQTGGVVGDFLGGASSGIGQVGGGLGLLKLLSLFGSKNPQATQER